MQTYVKTWSTCAHHNFLWWCRSGFVLQFYFSPRSFFATTFSRTFWPISKWGTWWSVLKALSLKHHISPSALTYLAYHHRGATPLMFSILDRIDVYVGSTPPPRMPVTSRIIPFLVGNPYKPLFVTVTGWAVDRMYMSWAEFVYVLLKYECIAFS